MTATRTVPNFPSVHRRGPNVFRFSLGLLFGLTLSVVSCESAGEREDRQTIAHTLDSLASTGEHGYFEAVYLVGRFQRTLMPYLPFEVEVSRMDEPFLEEPIGFRVLDTLQYRLMYKLDGQQDSTIGEFGKTVATSAFDLVVTKDVSYYTSMTDLYTTFDYELRVHAY